MFIDRCQIVVGSALAVVLASAGCGGGEAKKSGVASEKAAPAASTAPAKAKTGRDLEKVDVCRLLPGADVAKAFGGTLEGASGNSNAFSADCTYTIRLRTTKTVLVYLYPPDQFAMLKEMSEKAEPVAGLGDGAFVEQDSGWYELKVLKKGDVTIDARGDTLEEARKLAELVLARL
jgi:hypothetical protein